MKIKELTDLAAKAEAGTQGDVNEAKARLLTLGGDLLAVAQTEERDLSDDEQDALKAAAKAVDTLEAKSAKIKESAAVMAKFGTMVPVADGEAADAGGNRKGGRLNFKSVTEDISSKMGAIGPTGQKAFLSPGATITSVPMDARVVELDRVETSALSVLPAVSRGREYAYMRQNGRANNAAVVEPGELKPTTPIGLTTIEGKLKVVAHLSDAIDHFVLEDGPNLTQFVADELVYGLEVKLEQLVIAGVQATDGMTGILNTSGIQDVAFSGSPTETIRKGITAISTIGKEPNTLLINPVDWERVELARRSDGQFDQGSTLPVERSALRSWGLKVATTLALPAGTALVLDSAAVAIANLGHVDIRWSENVGSDFAMNQVRARVEGRFNVDVFRPLAVAKVDLTA